MTNYQDNNFHKFNIFINFASFKYNTLFMKQVLHKTNSSFKNFISSLVLLLMLLIGNMSWGQGSLYNPIFSENFGVLANATTLTTSNTAFSYIRVGTSTTGTPPNEIIAKNPSSFTASSALIGAKKTSISTVDKTGLTAFTSGTYTFKFKTPSSLSSAILSSAVGTGSSFGSTSGLAGSQLSSAFQIYGTKLQIRAGGAWTTVQTIIVSTTYTITIVFNNTAGSLNYGDAKTLASNKCHLWLNGAYVGEYAAATNNLAASAFRIYTTTSEFEVDDVAVYNSLPSLSTTWNGSTWSNGTPNSSLEANIAGTYNTTANGAFTAKKLSINSASLTINSGTNLNITNEVINNAGANGIVIENNANLIQTNNVINTGNTVVKRNSNALSRLDYTIWSSPVANQNLLAFSPATSTTRFYNYNTTTNLYSAIVNPSTIPFIVGAGNLIRMPNTAVTAPATETFNGQFTGVLNNGNIPVTLNYQDATHAYNMVGNPYPSAISAEGFLSLNSANIQSTLYFWRKTNGAGGSAYATYTAGGSVTTTPTSAAPNGTIQVGQGFFVAAKAAGNIPAFFQNIMRSGNNANQFFKTKNVVENNRIWLNLTNIEGAFSQMLVGYITDASQGVDVLDGKYINDSQVALTSDINNEEYVIQARSIPFNDTDVVNLNFKTDVAVDYTIAKDHVDGLFTTGQAIYLVDKTTGKETNLQTDTYTFTASAGVDNSRFQLTYKTSGTLNANNLVFNENSIYVYNQNGALNINAGENIMKNVKVFDITGRLVLEQKAVNASTTSFKNLKAEQQTLLIQITSDNNKVVNKKAIY